MKGNVKGSELIKRLGFMRLDGLSEEKETDKNMLYLLNRLNPKEKKESLKKFSINSLRNKH